jgi:MFS family permease
MAYASSAMSIGLILGPVVGGIIYARRGYYAAFGLAFAFIGLDFLLRVILVEKKIAVRYPPHVPHPGENPSIKLQPSSSQPQQTESSESLETHSRRQSVPNINESRIPTVIRILKFPRLLVALFISFVQALILSAFDATLPLYLNALFGYSALQAGTSWF